MDFELATPDTIAKAIAEEIGRKVNYRPVDLDGAARAAALIAELLWRRRLRRETPRTMAESVTGSGRSRSWFELRKMCVGHGAP